MPRRWASSERSWAWSTCSATWTSPTSSGKSIATAFIATLYGVLSANVFWLPVGERLKQRNKEEVARRTLAVEGVLSVQAGDNPRVVREKLEAFLPMPAWRRSRGRSRRRSGAGAGAGRGRRRPRMPTRMAHGRRKKAHAAEHENAERWLLTYADLITLLMVFFVVLYSMSQADSTKFKRVSASLCSKPSIVEVLQGRPRRRSIGRRPTPSHAGVDDLINGRRSAARSRDSEQDPRGRSKARRRSPDVTVGFDREGHRDSTLRFVPVRLGPSRAEAEFPGRAGRDRQVSCVRSNNDIRIDGHTDSMPIDRRAIRPTGSCPRRAHWR